MNDLWGGEGDREEGGRDGERKKEKERERERERLYNFHPYTYYLTLFQIKNATLNTA